MYIHTLPPYSSHHIPLHSDYWASEPDKLVKIRFGGSGPSAEPAETVTSVLEQAVVSYGEHVALAVKRHGQWQKWTYRKYQEDCMCLARAMIEVCMSVCSFMDVFVCVCMCACVCMWVGGCHLHPHAPANLAVIGY